MLYFTFTLHTKNPQITLTSLVADISDVTGDFTILFWTEKATKRPGTHAHLGGVKQLE